MMRSGLLIALCITGLLGGQTPAAEVQGILKTYCYSCHSPEEQKGELDLQSTDIRKDPGVWEHALDQIALEEMPPKKAKQMSPADKARLTAWIRGTLDEIALSQAGDPGRVVLRRLSNVEYAHTLRDLTGIPTLDPAREFPIDGAAGEGFTNVGAALVMSPGLLTKYMEAAKEVSAHAVFTPHGLRWSSSTSPLDWTEETLTAIRRIYDRYTVKADGTQKVVDGIKLDTGTGGGRLPLKDYLEALQGRRNKDGLSPKYLALLRAALESEKPSVLLDPLRAKFKKGQLTVADIEPWQSALWKFNNVGHLASSGGLKTWQEPVTPLLPSQEHRIKLSGGRDHTLYLVNSAAADGDEGDQVVWENTRLVAPGRQDLPISNLSGLLKHLETERAQILTSTESCLNAMAGGSTTADPRLLAVWKDYFGLTPVKFTSLLNDKSSSIQNHDFIRGWRGADALSILANSSGRMERIPGLMQPHSIAMHPAPDRDSMIAWQAKVSGSLRISGDVVRAHTGCGSGVKWAVEVRRGHAVERLASGLARDANPISFGPFEDVRIEPGQHVVLLIGPNNGSHTCGLATVNLSIRQDEKEWDIAKDLSPNILAGNPHGPWSFLSQATTAKPPPDLPAPMIAWRKAPSPALATAVRQHLEKDFPLTHPLLAHAIRSFESAAKAEPIAAAPSSIIEIHIPAALSNNAELVTTARLASPKAGSVQTQLLSEKPAAVPAGLLSHLPVMVGDSGKPKEQFTACFDEFRSLFPASLCYSRIVPVDEGVTLTLYHREDEHLRRLLLTDAETRELDRLWEELIFVSEAPLKQIDAFEQLVQYATQIRAERAAEFEKLRGSIMQAAEKFKADVAAAQKVQADAVIVFASQAWRRPLRPSEIDSLRKFTPSMMLVRVLTSSSFLYRGEDIPAKTQPVNDWELATRLSYFLWSSTPDEELRTLAAEGRLSDPKTLAAQTRRMLQSPRINRLASEFGCQWLHVRDVATLDEKSERHFPEFLQIRESMQQEVERFFTDLFQRNESLLSLLGADHSFVNGQLAKHYGLEAKGDEWRRVEGMRKLGRGGILGFAAPLAKHSGASRTSAILRGTWLSEVVLGDKLPRPPKGVPVLPDESPVGLTERQLIERHTSDTNCASCHKRIDPYGFALEGFDAIGRQRKADTTTELFDGTKVDGLAELRDYLLTRRRADFVEQACRKLLGYSLGRACQLSDRPLLETMARSDLKVGTLVEIIVNSRQFREVRGREVAAQ